jgi:hypothetical protein
LAYLCKGGEVSEVKEVIVTRKQWLDTALSVTGLGVPAWGHYGREGVV